MAGTLGQVPRGASEVTQATQGQHFQHMSLGKIIIPAPEPSGMTWINMDVVASLATQFPLARITNPSLGGSSTSSQLSTDVTSRLASWLA